MEGDSEKMELDLLGKVALVTGAGQGVGKEIGRALAAEGARVVINDFFEERAVTAAAEIESAGGVALGLQAANALKPAGEELIESFPRLLGERLLASLGYSVRAVDGLVDEDTEAALALFENEHGVPAGPSMDEATLAHLREVLYAQIPYKPGSTDLMPPQIAAALSRARSL